MRILCLTILFLAPLYYFQHNEVPESPEIDSVKLKMGAPKRAPAEKKASQILAAPAPVKGVEVVEQPELLTDTPEDGEEVHWNDLEEGWNTELKDMLGRLEPADGEEIYKNYMKEQETYQTELEALMNEKQQKTSDEAALEIDQLIVQLDNKHQDRLKDILGAHYEAVRDQYQQFMDSSEE